MKVLCFDKATFGKAVVLDNGMLRAPAKISKPGVFPYVFGGKQVNVFRSPEEVFKASTLASFEQVTLVDEHPRKEGGLVTSKNASRLSMGSVANVRQEDGYMTATIVVQDASCIDKVLKGKDQLSCGYECQYVEEAGVYEGKHYELKQINIQGNHVALTHIGRQGADVRIELDSCDVMVECEQMSTAVGQEEPIVPLTESKKMPAKITLDGLDFEVEPTVAQAIEKTLAAQVKVVAETTARADAAEARVKVLDSALEEAKSPERLAAAVTARVSIETQAKEFLPKNTDVSKLSDLDIKKAVIVALDSAAALDGKSEDYIQALFDASTRLAVKKNPLTEAVRKSVEGQPTITGDSVSPKQKMLKDFFAKK